MIGKVSKNQWYLHRLRHRSGFRTNTRYLLMIRLVDWRMSRLIHAVSHLSLNRADISKFPHITLYGSFRLMPGTTISQIRDRIAQAATRVNHLPFTITGWTRMRGRKGEAIGYHVELSPVFTTVYREISRSLIPITQSRIWIDRAPEQRRFHITIAYNMSDADANRLWACLHDAAPFPDLSSMNPSDHAESRDRSFEAECTDLEALRISLYRNGALANEFDLPNQKWFDRAACFDSMVLKRTLRAHRRLQGYELERPHFADQPDTYLISDLHLDHENIIRYCRRPFSDAHEMNRVLVQNWNDTIRSEDIVYYLGDLRYHRDLSAQVSYRDTLHGRICFIAGNHDDDIPGAVPSKEITCEATRFLLIHDPDQAPPDYPGWVIHGHAHNHDLCKYPFFNRFRRRINVSAELIGYRPVRLGQLIELIRNNHSSLLRILPRKKEKLLKND
ncbi:MAG: 2'-5' RNA ligase family protein [Methanoregulaceae archaeon]|nr:2'-5' RNA ligase family protein [Methanoregulaceae archaeon]